MMKKNTENPGGEHLALALSRLQTREEVMAYLEDICTPQEIRTIAQRSEVAWLLRHGETYQAISEKTGASTATISRVSRSMENSAGGYEAAFRALEDASEEPEEP